jgi:type I restriction enzyme, R subunit
MRSSLPNASVRSRERSDMPGPADAAPPPRSNFAFLHPSWPEIALEAAQAERNAATDPRSACFYARRALELALHWLYEADGSLSPPDRPRLAAMLFEPSFQAAVDEVVRTKMDFIRRQGNAAVHERRSIKSEAALAVVRELFHVMFWVARTYARDVGDVPDARLAFDPAAVPRPAAAPQRQVSIEELRRREAEQAQRDEQLAQARANNAALQAQLDALRAEIAAVKAANEARPDEHDYDEEQTRDRYIDLLLQEAGWSLDRPEDREFEVDGMPNQQGKGFVDYVLWGDDGLPLAVVEAKRTRHDATIGRQQAKLYADCLERRYGQRPAIFYTNGYETWLWDDTRYPPRRVQGFYTKDELATLIGRRTSARSLADVDIDATIVERHYQQRAIRRIAEAFEHHRQRKALIVMATGAGKTRTVIALTKLLMEAGWVKRVLFLADRVALVNQAVGAFKAHLPDVTTVNLVTEKANDGRVYVSTYPTVMGLIGDGEAGAQRRFGPGFFDLVVIDEAHRSIYKKYRAIFAYFDALLVGLTATPKDDVDRDTYRMFDLEPGVPTDAYPLDEAVVEGYLVPPRAIRVPLKFPSEGIRYDDLPEEEREQWEELDWGDAEDPPAAVAPEAVNRWLFNADTVDKVLETLMVHGYRVASGDRLGKTIVFAKNNDHAEFIAQRFDVNYPEHAGHFTRVITVRTKYAQTLIDDFSVRDKTPHIAISVDMLDTGIDIPEVVNLVFFKPVRSKTKFTQMIGRGTRLCPELFGPGEDKREFRVFDVCENFAYFDQAIPEQSGAVAPSLRARLFNERLELIIALSGATGGGDGTVSEGGLREDLVATLQEQLRGMNLDNFLVRPHRRLVERYRESAAWKDIDLERSIELGTAVADLPSAARDDDEEAKRFDLIVLHLQLCRLRGEPGQERLRQQVQEIAAGLLEQLAIPAVREREALLAELADDEWWVDVTLPMLEQARRRIRGLVRLLDKRKRAVVYTDFTDELREIEEVPFPHAGAAGADFERFREKARAYLRAHADHVALQKLRRNRPLTQTDLDELERMLAEAGVGAPEDLARARVEGDGLGVFIRSLVGLDRAAATEALSGFIDGRVLTADQHDFVALVVEHLTANGAMDPGLLYEPPFTNVASGGPEALFPDADVDALIAAIRAVNANARPQDEVA